MAEDIAPGKSATAAYSGIIRPPTSPSKARSRACRRGEVRGCLADVRKGGVHLPGEVLRDELRPVVEKAGEELQGVHQPWPWAVEHLRRAGAMAGEGRRGDVGSAGARGDVGSAGGGGGTACSVSGEAELELAQQAREVRLPGCRPPAPPDRRAPLSGCATTPTETWWSPPRT